MNFEFNVPYYIFEEIVEYIELNKEKCKTAKWENIKYLLNLAVVSNKITKEQSNFIRDKFSREEQYKKD